MEILWVLFAILTAVVGGAKSRSVIGWFVIGALLGPIGFILIAVMPAIPKH